ncbi:MAG: hypothetical protein WCG81_02560 [Candidatus Angelobacter sp.]
MTKDEWRLLGYGSLAAFLMALFLVPILVWHKNFPRFLAEIVLGVIALTVFALSKYMEHRGKSN